MASSLQSILFSCILIISFSFSGAQSSVRPRALLLPVSKDASTLQYLTHFKQRSPLVSTKLVLDLGGQILWVDCEEEYLSSTYAPIRCGSPECALAGSIACGECAAPIRPGCNNNTCGVFPDNTVTRTSGGAGGELAHDVVSLQSTNGRHPGPYVSVPRYVFSCGTQFLLKGLAKGVKGMAGLGRTRYGLPLQFSAAFKFPMKFAICLPSSTKSNGVVFFGDSPYVMLPDMDDAGAGLTYTPLFINRVSTSSIAPVGQRSSEYFIGIKSIKISERAIPLNTKLLTIKRGNGGTKISTVTPYTTMETSIYNSFTNAFVKASASMNITRVASVAPFKFCFSSKNVAIGLGPLVPPIDLVLQSEDKFWRIFGANSMVQVRKNVVCLGFMDGGSKARTSIVIGAYQLEDNLLQFDLRNSRLGFSSSLLNRGITCSSFNFTSIA